MTIRLKCLSPRPMASLRLLCLPFAGAGAAAFRGWSDLLPAHVEAFAVQLPQREDRLSELAPQTWTAMFSSLTDAVGALHPQPTAIFGHSFGAVVGLELARWIQATGHGSLVHFFPSARPWPGLPPMSLAPLLAGDDDALLAGMDRRFGSLSTSLAHPDIREIALPALRADLHLLDQHLYSPGIRLTCPTTVFAGKQDLSTDQSGLAGWRHESSGAFEIVHFDGGHFFLESLRSEIVATISARLPTPSAW